jgi:hypothetical protein
VPARYCATYFPRTPPFMDENSYSGRVSFRLFLFIKPSFMACCSSGADDPHCFALFGVFDNQDPFAAGHPYSQEPQFVNRVIRIGKSCRERVVQHSCRFVEIDPMLPKIGHSFLRIPCEDHTDNIRCMVRELATELLP